ncbi:MAG: phage portal protein family protein [Coriobacteriia bacterium]
MALAVRSTVDGQFWLDTKALQERIFGGGEVPETDAWYRRYFGRSLTPATIEEVLRHAESGYMRDLTDLESEIVGIDGHLFSSVGKRFPVIASVDYDVVPASGPGLDPEKAQQCAEIVRHGLAGIRNLRQALVDLSWGHFHGRSAIEKQWEYKPGNQLLKWSISELNWIHPRRLSFGPERELRLVDSLFYTGYFKAVGFDLRSIPFKWIPFTPRLRNEYPEREGVGPICLYWAYFKRFSTRERLILMEVFGKPWRIIEWDKDIRNIPTDGLQRAQDTADKLGAMASAAMPIGAHLNVEQPADGAGEVHGDVVEQANDEISKAINGQTRTTSAKSGAGLNASADDVAVGEQDSIVDADGWRLSEVLTEHLAKDLVALNRGPAWAVYTPQIKLRTQRPMPRKERIENTKTTLALGIPLKLEQVYEETGFERPDEQDATVQLVNAGDRDAFGNATSVTKTVIIDPTKPPPIPPRQPPGGLPPEPTPLKPEATGEPGEPNQLDEQLTASTPASMPEPTPAELLAAKMTESGVDRCEHGKPNRCQLCGVERARDFDIVGGETVWKVAWRAIEATLATSAIAVSGGELVLMQRLQAASKSASQHGHLVCRAKQPDSANGTPELLIDRGVAETARETARWGNALVDATEGLDNAGKIFERLNRVAATLPLASFARTAERKILHGLMLGALDSVYERENDELVPIESFAQIRDLVLMSGEQQPLPFAEQPFDRAVRMFRQRLVLPRDTFEQLSGAAKRRAFTIARMARQDLLATAHAELARMIQSGENAMVTGEGPSLRDFRRFAAERLESAGWTPANPSHVETIYRTNVMGAYGDGRKAEMTQPAVLQARPIWQARGVDDSRARPTHKAAHGLCFAAGDASWPATPWGYNCRCRIVSRSQRWLAASGKALSAPPAGLPDEGFDSVEGSLLGMMAAE